MDKTGNKKWKCLLQFHKTLLSLSEMLNGLLLKECVMPRNNRTWVKFAVVKDKCKVTPVTKGRNYTLQENLRNILRKHVFTSKQFTWQILSTIQSRGWNGCHCEVVEKLLYRRHFLADHFSPSGQVFNSVESPLIGRSCVNQDSQSLQWFQQSADNS